MAVRARAQRWQCESRVVSCPRRLLLHSEARPAAGYAGWLRPPGVELLVGVYILGSLGLVDLGRPSVLGAQPKGEHCGAAGRGRGRRAGEGARFWAGGGARAFPEAGGPGGRRARRPTLSFQPPCAQCPTLGGRRRTKTPPQSRGSCSTHSSSSTGGVSRAPAIGATGASGVHAKLTGIQVARHPRIASRGRVHGYRSDGNRPPCRPPAAALLPPAN